MQVKTILMLIICGRSNLNVRNESFVTITANWARMNPQVRNLLVVHHELVVRIVHRLSLNYCPGLSVLAGATHVLERLEILP
jgi:hypothetical protein